MAGSRTLHPISKAWPALLCCLTALLGTDALPGAEASLAIASPIAYEGDAVTLQVMIVNPTGRLGRPQLPAVPGLTIRGPGGPSQQTQFVNGQQKQSIIFQYEIT